MIIDDTNDNGISDEPNYTPAEIARDLKVSTDTAIRWFSDEPGVIVLGNAERMHRRKKEFLRVPRSVYLRFLEKRRHKAK